MRRNKIAFLLITLLTFSGTKLLAQQDLTLYNMKLIPQRMEMNPANAPSSRFNIGLPVISSFYGNFGNSGFRLTDVFTKRADDSIYIDLDKALGSMKPRNFLTSSLHTDLLSIGFRIKGSYISFGATEKLFVRFSYRSELFRLIWKGNFPTIGTEQQIGPTADASHYREYWLGWAQDLMKKKLTVGTRLKYLYGMENLHTAKSDVSLTTNPDNFFLTGKADVDIRTSGFAGKFDPNSNYLFGKKNRGFAMDLGANYKISKHFSASASIIDLGNIRWSDNTKSFISKNPGSAFTYGGLDLNTFINDSSTFDKSFEKVLDSLYNTFELVEGSGAYRTKLPAQLYVGLNYDINEKNSAGLLFYGQFFDKKMYPGASVSYNTQLGRWFSASASWSAFNRSYSNLGLGGSLNLGPIQFYAVSDNVLGVFVLDRTKNFHFHTGMNLTFGRKPLDKDKDGVPDKEDNCPDVKGPKNLKGCPDTDGDLIIDKLDSCPTLPGLAQFKGCPDRDHDSIIDPNDDCPDSPGLAKFNGCPDSDDDNIMNSQDSCPYDAGPVYTIGCPDRDNDSVPDKDDLCPDTAGLKTLQGCPDRDNDGLTDSRDSCPDLAGPIERNGCPDTDGDGVFDNEDNCPEVAGTIENKGCPFKDTDGDGIKDTEDACVEKPGPIENKGCPYADTDGDGILDKDDKCPQTPGVIENNGCPEIKKEEQEVLNTAFSSLEFQTGKDIIKPESYAGLDELAELMRKKADWNLLLEGHTDDVGDDKKNFILSRKRAEAVKKYLVMKGVNVRKITVQAFGETKPIADNKTPEGREKNRRVDMTVIFK